MLPVQAEIEVPLLEILEQFGGEARPKQIYPLITAKFPQITSEDLKEKLKHGEIKWHNRIQWTRQSLVEAGQMISPQRGIWAITDRGRARLEQDKLANAGQINIFQSQSVNLVDIHEKYEIQFRSKLLDRLYELSPKQFEHFAKLLLAAYGFVKMTVKGVGKDGGVDGHGMLKVGLSQMAVAFQCKRWEGTVSRPEVDKFRGSIQGEFEQGLFFTTSDFTKEATNASIKKGAVPIILLNGESIVDLMIDKEFGVQKKPLQIYEDELDTIFGDLK
ncbi:MAG: restriction endonuclease [Isosphaeraceae bacterium]